MRDRRSRGPLRRPDGRAERRLQKSELKTSFSDLLISTVTASSSRLSWASSRYLSDPERSLGRVTRAGDGAPIDDGDEAPDDGPSTDDEA